MGLCPLEQIELKCEVEGVLYCQLNTEQTKSKALFMEKRKSLEHGLYSVNRYKLCVLLPRRKPKAAKHCGF